MSALLQRLYAGLEDSGLAAMHQLYVKAANSRTGWYIGDSEIAGQGIFAARDYQPGDVLGLAMTDGDRDEFGTRIWNLTEMARYCNHQLNANSLLVRDGDCYNLVASKAIQTDEEIVANYAQVTKAIGPHARMLWDGKPVPVTTLGDYKERNDG